MTLLPAEEINAHHIKSDVDTGPFSQHHTLGRGPNQAAPGNHSHPEYAGGGGSDDSGLPAGTIMQFAGTTVPDSWLRCDGTIKVRDDFLDLFNVIGTTYNTGGETALQFRLPNFVSKYPMGGTPGTYGGSQTITVANLPAHTHTIDIQYGNVTATGGSAIRIHDIENVAGGGGTVASPAGNATGSGTAYWPPYLQTYFIIKHTPGIAGTQGPQGIPGPPGSSPTIAYTHTQGSPVATWIINHPLSFQPNITIVDSTNRQMEGDVVYTDADTITVTFSSAFSGKAYLS